MKKTQIITIASFTVIMIFGFWFHARGSTPTSSVTLEGPGRPLLFSSVAVEQLLVATPGTSLIRVKTIELTDVGEQKKVWVHLYRYAADPHSNDIIAFLADGQKVYSLGTVSINGERDVTVSLIDSNHDKINEVRITGSFGDGVVTTQIFGMRKKGHWVQFLSHDNIQTYDLNQDGKVELVAASQGKDSPYVIIFRWRKNHFEKADVSGSTGSIYATLHPHDGSIAIKVSKEVDKRIQQIIYHYTDGKLYDVKTPSIPIE